MHLSIDQFQRIGLDRLQARARHWQVRADRALPPPQRQDPLARLNALAEQFLLRERGLLGQAGVSDARLAAWCTAGDLLIGQGRCVRLLASSPLKADPDEAVAWLKEVLRDHAGFES